MHPRLLYRVQDGLGVDIAKRQLKSKNAFSFFGKKFLENSLREEMMRLAICFYVCELNWSLLLLCRSREGGNSGIWLHAWVPAFAGKTKGTRPDF